MTEQALALAARIRDEWDELERVLLRVEEGWRRAQREADDYYLDGVALNLHSLYGGLERLWELIATRVDAHLPQGEHWHQTLLAQMADEVPAVRPAVISEATQARLDDYRGFRHVVRDVYTFQFDPNRVGRLAVNARPVFEGARSELLAFAEFLEQQG